MIRVLVGAALVAGGMVGFRAYTAKAAQSKTAAGKDAAATADRVVPVLAVPVAQRDMPIYLDGLGNVLATATVTVRALVDGRIDRIAFTEGQEVHKGDLLAQIDPRPFQNQLRAAEAAMARDRAQLAGAVRNLERYTELAKNGLSSAQQVDDQTALVNQLRGTVAADQASIDTARLSLDYAHITSPIDGVTGIRLVDQGNIIHPGDQGGIVMLTALDPIAVVFTLPQDNLPAIAKEMASGKVEVDAMSRDGGTKLAAGTLAVIDNQINAATATIKLKALFPNKDKLLWPNQFVKTRLLLSTRKNALVIPAAVVQHGPNGDFAYAVGPDQKAVVKPITVEVTQGDQAVVSGLQAGEQVVLDGQNQLRPGSRVQQRGADAPPLGAGSAQPKGEGKPGGEGKSHGDGKMKPPTEGGGAKP